MTALTLHPADAATASRPLSLVETRRPVRGPHRRDRRRPTRRRAPNPPRCVHVHPAGSAGCCCRAAAGRERPPCSRSLRGCGRRPPARSGTTAFGSMPAPPGSGVGYVPQDDIIHVEMPLRRTLQYAARLRLPAGTSPGQADRAVDETLRDLDLADRRDVAVRMLSGGQRKRASIAVELLTQPRTFFLDEPTSGLDPVDVGGGRAPAAPTHRARGHGRPHDPRAGEHRPV